ncbi:MAG: hypothetical protein CM1200mP2_16500 [Planctomycetaceae bacterium]|nr:MAG: hypothetical protein CM1200mP2_16500 [Planctomycetaceae bacterium]
MTKAHCQESESISQPSTGKQNAIPTRAPAVINPLAVARRSGGMMSETTRAAPGCSGALQTPPRPRITKRATRSPCGSSVNQPITPVSTLNVPIVMPKMASARPGPIRSISQPPGSMPIV